MTSTNQRLTANETSISNLNARIIAITPNNLIFAALGAFVKYGCKVTEGPDDTDLILSLEGQAAGDSANLNPDLSATPTRQFEFPNIASLKGGDFVSNDTSATVITAPTAGTSRYDIAYIFAGKEGAGFAIADGSASASVLSDFTANGLQTGEFGLESPDFDPDIPVGAVAVARIYVAADVTAITDTEIADLRSFSSFTDGLVAASFANPPVLGSVTPNVVNATTLNAVEGNFTGDIDISHVSSPAFTLTDTTTGGVSARFQVTDTVGRIGTTSDDNFVIQRNSLDILTITANGIDLESGDSYFVDGNNVLSQTVLGSTVLASSLTSLGTIASLVATTADINGGTIDGSIIGGSVTAAGSFTILSASGTITGPSGTWSATGIDLATGDSYSVDSNVVLTQTTLGGTVLASSLTSLGTIASLVATTADINAGTVDAVIGGTTPQDGSFTTLSATGTITGPSGTWNSGGMDLAASDSYAINSTDVLTATVLGTGVVTSSLTTVAALNAGSITSGFGNIDIGSSTFDTTGAVGIGTLTATDGAATMVFSDVSQDTLNISGNNAMVKVDAIGSTQPGFRIDVDGTNEGGLVANSGSNFIRLEAVNGNDLQLSTNSVAPVLTIANAGTITAASGVDLNIAGGIVDINTITNERSLTIATSATGANVTQIIANSLTNGRLISATANGLITGTFALFSTSSVATNTKSLFTISSSSALATGTTVLELVQASTGDALRLTGGDLTLTDGTIQADEGIKLGGTAAANLLDDYEEGTWTPSLGGDTTYGTQLGTYTKIGNQVIVKCKLVVTTLGTGSATVLTGLPFTEADGTGGFAGSSVAFFSSLAVSVISLMASANIAGTDIKFVRQSANDDTADAAPAIFGDGATVHFSFTYTAA